MTVTDARLGGGRSCPLLGEARASTRHRGGTGEGGSQLADICHIANRSSRVKNPAHGTLHYTAIIMQPEDGLGRVKQRLNLEKYRLLPHPFKELGIFICKIPKRFRQDCCVLYPECSIIL